MFFNKDKKEISKLELYSPSLELLNTAYKVRESGPIYYQIEEISLDEAKKRSEKFMKKHFKLQPIFHLTSAEKDELDKMLNSKDNKNAKTYLINNLKIIDPYKLPIKVEKKKVSGNSSCHIFDIALYEKNKLKKTFVINEKITIDDYITNESSYTLTHEITHSELETLENSYTNKFNSEVLSILLECLNEFDEKGRLKDNISLKRRQLNLANLLNILFLYNRDKKYCSSDYATEANIYFESTIQALDLYDKFINSTSANQNKIIKSIQEIFDGEKSVEKLLSENKISIKESTNNFCKKI